MENVQNKTAMVTGGASGIGYSITEELLRNGAKRIAIIDLPVANSYDTTTRLQKQYGKERVIYFPCDVTNAESFNATFKQIVNALDGLDILVNNAGMLNDHYIERTFAINVVALIRGSILAMNHMSKDKGGKGGTIVNISSISALERFSIASVYCASKHAVLGFSLNLEACYNKSKVRILTMCPGFTKTSMNLKDKYLDIVDYDTMYDNIHLQSAAHVGYATVELIKKGKNGAIWVVENSEPPFEIEIQPYIRV